MDGVQTPSLGVTAAIGNQEVDSPEAAEAAPVKISSELIDRLRIIFKPLDADTPDIEASNKSKLLLQLLKHCIIVGDKVLVFSQSIATLDFLENLVKQKYHYFRMDGRTKMSDRPAMIKEFNRSGGNYNIFLISTKAGGVGFNLPGANRVVIYDFSYNPTHEEQAIGRAYRLGQIKPVFVYRFISAGTFEENMHNTTVFKIQLAHRVVEKKNPRSLATRQKEWFRHAVKPDQQDLREYIGKDKILDRVISEMNEEGKSHICGLTTTETLQEESEEILTAEEEAEVKRMVEDELKRVEDPDAWRAEMARRQLVQARRQAAHLASTSAGVQAFHGNGMTRMAPFPTTANPSAIPPSTFQARQREVFNGPLNGLPLGLSLTAPPRNHTPSSPLLHRTQPQSVRTESSRQTPRASLGQTKDAAATNDMNGAYGTAGSEKEAANRGLGAPDSDSPSKAKSTLSSAFSWVSKLGQ